MNGWRDTQIFIKELKNKAKEERRKKEKERRKKKREKAKHNSQVYNIPF